MRTLFVFAALAGAFLVGNADALAQYNVDFNANDGGYTVENVGNIQNPWVWAQGQGWRAGQNQGGDDNPNNLSKLTSPELILGGGPVELSFNHRYSFEGDWDAGAIFTSVNGGAFQQVPGGSFTSNGYTKTGLLGEHQLNGGEGFSGDTAGFTNGDLITTTADLGTHSAGDTLQIQFFGAWDQFATGSLSPPECHIDSAQVNGVVPEPTSLVLAALGLLGLAGCGRHRRRR